MRMGSGEGEGTWNGNNRIPGGHGREGKKVAVVEQKKGPRKKGLREGWP